MLSDHERRRLLEIESSLAGDDPGFARSFDPSRWRARRRIIAVTLAIGCCIAATTLLLLHSVGGTVLAVCGIGVAAGMWTLPSTRRSHK